MSTCLGMLAGCGNRAPKPVTFNKDIAPIVFANCVSCHRPGGDGPFSLLTYADAAKHAQAMFVLNAGPRQAPAIARN